MRCYPTRSLFAQRRPQRMNLRLSRNQFLLSHSQKRANSASGQTLRRLSRACLRTFKTRSPQIRRLKTLLQWLSRGCKNRFQQSRSLTRSKSPVARDRTQSPSLLLRSLQSPTASRKSRKWSQRSAKQKPPPRQWSYTKKLHQRVSNRRLQSHPRSKAVAKTLPTRRGRDLKTLSELLTLLPMTNVKLNLHPPSLFLKRSRSMLKAGSPVNRQAVQSRHQLSKSSRRQKNPQRLSQRSQLQQRHLKQKKLEY